MPEAVKDRIRKLLTREKFEELREAQRRANELVEALDAAEQCGADCEVFREVNAEQLRRLQEIERQFFSPPPS